MIPRRGSGFLCRGNGGGRGVEHTVQLCRRQVLRARLKTAAGLHLQWHKGTAGHENVSLGSLKPKGCVHENRMDTRAIRARTPAQNAGTNPVLQASKAF